MKCRCKTKQPMVYVCQYKRENFSSYTTMNVLYCFNCGRLLKQGNTLDDWWEPKEIQEQKTVERLAKEKAEKERKERKEYERLKRIYG